VFYAYFVSFLRRKPRVIFLLIFLFLAVVVFATSALRDKGLDSAPERLGKDSEQEIIFLTEEKRMEAKAEQRKLKAREKMKRRKKMQRGSNISCPDLSGAIKYTRKNAANISFAVRCREGIRGYRKKDLFPSASASKTLLLLAFLRKEDNISSYREDLEKMIRYSDNKAASKIYSILGDDTLAKVAKSVGLRDTQFNGGWSSIRFSSADYARLFASFPASFPQERRRFAMNLLRSVSASQRWGIPRTFSRFRVYFKGGWRPEANGYLLLQGALLEKKGKRFSLAVFSNGSGNQDEAIASLEKVSRLIRGAFSLKERGR
jgi:hypothetical protein